MNWRRGLFRLWAILSVAWIVGTIVLTDPIQKISNPIAAYGGNYPIGSLGNRPIAAWREAGFSDDEIGAYLSRRALVEFAELAALPPVLLLAAGFGGWWIARGFRAAASN